MNTFVWLYRATRTRSSKITKARQQKNTDENWRTVMTAALKKITTKISKRLQQVVGSLHALQ